MTARSLLAASLWLMSCQVGAVLVPIIPLPVQMNLSGQGSLPLAYQAGSGTEDYGFVDSTVTLSTLAGSQLGGSINIPDEYLLPGPLPPGIDPVTLSLQFSLFLNLGFVDNAPGSGNDYTGSLAPGFTLTPALPLVIDSTGEIDFASLDILDPNPLAAIPTSLTTISTSIKENLGVDVNQNGDEDFIEFTVNDFLLDENDLTFDFIDPADPNQGFIVTAATLMLSGSVADITTDPPFTLELSTETPPAIPVPAAFWLFATALIGLAGLKKMGKGATGRG